MVCLYTQTSHELRRRAEVVRELDLLVDLRHNVGDRLRVKKRAYTDEFRPRPSTQPWYNGSWPFFTKFAISALNFAAFRCNFDTSFEYLFLRRSNEVNTKLFAFSRVSGRNDAHLFLLKNLNPFKSSEVHFTAIIVSKNSDEKSQPWVQKSMWTVRGFSGLDSLVLSLTVI